MTTDKSKIHFVLIAGFSSDHKEAYGLKHSLMKLGYSAYAISFYGKDYIDDFTNVTKEQCIANVCQYIDDCCDQYDEVYGIGISLGGSLLLEYAKNKSRLKGMVSIGTPFKLKKRGLISIAQFLLPIFYPVWRRLQKIKKLRLSPVGAGKEMIGYMENEFLLNLDKVKTPVLFLQSKKDKVTDWHALEDNFAKVGSPIKEIEYFHNGRHVIDHDPDLVRDMSLEFLKKI
jgi:esterase/lipase